MARSFICKFGMSKTLGTRKYGNGKEQVFLGKSYGSDSIDYSDETAKLIDDEIKNLIDNAYSKAFSTLKKYKKKLIEIADIILEKETIDRDEFLKLLDTKKSKTSSTAKPKKTETSQKIKLPSNKDLPPMGASPAAAPA